MIWQVDCDRNAMVYPLLDSTLHTYFHQPINVICRCLMIWRAGYKGVYFLLCVLFTGINTIDTHPLQELTMIDYVLFETVSNLIYKVDMDISVIRINLTAALINGHKHGLYATGSLRHQ